MKLLQLNVTANWGSTGKIAEGIGQAAIQRDWESVIAYGRYMNPSQSNLIKVGNKFDVYAHYAEARLFDREGLGSRSSTRTLIKQIVDLSPDIIQLHNIHDHWLNYPLLFDYLASIETPIIWTFHDCWAFTGGCAHFENADCYKWENLYCQGACPRYHKKSAQNFKNRLEVFSKIGSRFHIVTVSEWLANYVRKSLFSEIGAFISVINNGINIDGVFRPSNSPKERMILGVSNVWPEYKGLGDFIQLRKSLSDDIKIILVGLTSKQVESLPDGIKGITRTANAMELADLYRAASIFVNPTYNDSFPTVNLEALACGTPVVTYQTGGSPEAIDKKTGIVVEKGNVNALSDAIMTVLNNPDCYTSSDCRNRAVTKFNKDVQFGKYIDLYESILSKK